MERCLGGSGESLMSGIRLSDQHFALGDPNELAIHVPRATRRHIGIEQFSSVELVDELLGRPNGSSSVLALVSKVMGKFLEIDGIAASLTEQVAAIKAEDNPLMTGVIKELASVRSELLDVKEASLALRNEIVSIRTRFAAEISEANALTAQADEELAQIKDKPYKVFTVKQLIGAIWKRLRT